MGHTSNTINKVEKTISKVHGKLKQKKSKKMSFSAIKEKWHSSIPLTSKEKKYWKELIEIYS